MGPLKFSVTLIFFDFFFLVRISDIFRFSVSTLVSPGTTRLMQPTHTPQQEEGSQFCVYDGGPTLVDPKDPQQNRKEKGSGFCFLKGELYWSSLAWLKVTHTHTYVHRHRYEPKKPFFCFSLNFCRTLCKFISPGKQVHIFFYCVCDQFTWSGLCVNEWKRRTLELRSRPIFRVGKDFFAMRKSSKRKKKKKNVMIVKIRSEVLHFRPPTFSLTFA